MMADLGLALGSDDRVHAPVGLEIGSETPHEIALAMTAEVQGVLTQSAATSRPRERQVA
jgi:xanthine/CO dehydrogenase XdhC/CoxF family maturation factor